MWKSYIALSFSKYRKFKNPKMSYIFEKVLSFPIICSKYENDIELN